MMNPERKFIGNDQGELKEEPLTLEEKRNLINKSKKKKIIRLPETESGRSFVVDKNGSVDIKQERE